MSKWKSRRVTIIQAFTTNGSSNLLGLGDDQKIYTWHTLEGAWEKFWAEDEDSPE